MLIKTPETLEEFLEIFDGFSNSGYDYFRGQADETWEILPGIARNKEIFKKVLDIEAKLNRKFAKNLSEYNLSNLLSSDIISVHNSWAMLMASQHYGLPTRLLDFSFNKFVALEFAVLELSQINKNSAIIVYKNADQFQNNKHSFFEDKFSVLEKSFFLNPPIIKSSDGNGSQSSETRKFIQNSKFFYRGSEKLFCCLSLDDTHTQNLEKIIIHKNLKPLIVKFFSNRNQILYDSYKGKNGVDFISGFLKEEYSRIKKNTIESYLLS